MVYQGSLCFKMVQKWPTELGSLPKLHSAGCASVRARGQFQNSLKGPGMVAARCVILSWGGRDALMGPWSFLTSQSRLIEEPRVPMKDCSRSQSGWFLRNSIQGEPPASTDTCMHLHILTHWHIHISTYTTCTHIPHTRVHHDTPSVKKNCKLWILILLTSPPPPTN